MKTTLKDGFHFEVIKTSKKSKARRGRLTTPHGVIETPAFVGVGTNGSLKSINTVATRKMGLALMFCNTYHLMLHPGAELVQACGGLHKFINYDGPLITDSGGFQVFSLVHGSVHQELKSQGKKFENSWVIKLDEQGVKFRSYRDGKIINLTPETSVIAQQQLGADIIIPLDELPAYHVDEKTLKLSFERTHRWMERSLKQHQRENLPQIMYGVIHGGLNSDLRVESIKRLQASNFEGIALGGSFGKNHNDLETLLQICNPHLDPLYPRHLLGIGDPYGIEIGIANGFDTFDSAYPSKIARHGSLLTASGVIKIREQKYFQDTKPIEENCGCFTCLNYSRAYLHHLYKAHESVFCELASTHNIYYMIALTKKYQLEIENE